MKPTSTPGPWKFLKADGRIVYSVGHTDHEILWSDADYQLIAAAPDMLEALRDAVEEMDAWMLERTPDADDIDKMRSDFRAILAKAEAA